MRRAGVEGLLGGLLDVRRRVEVRLADLEVDDVAARALERLRAREDFEGRLRAEAQHPRRDVHGIPLSEGPYYKAWNSSASPRVPS